MASKKNSNASQTMLAPQSNPDVGKPATLDGARGAATATIEAKSHIGGSELTAKIDGRHTGGVERRYKYWVGVTASAPVEAITMGGICFPKVNEVLHKDPRRTGQTKRQGRIGSIVYLTEDKVRRIVERLPQTVIRYLDGKQGPEQSGMQTMDDVAERPRRGQVITIPTDKEIQDRQAKGKATRAYIPDPNRDVPASRFMFAVLCEDQERPAHGDYYPDPLEVTGLEWPDEL